MFRISSLQFLDIPFTPTTPSGATYCTPEIDTSEIIVDFSGISYWTFRDILLRNLTSKSHFPKGYRFPGGFPLETSNGFSEIISNGVSLLCDFWCVIFCPNSLKWPIHIYIYIYIYVYIHTTTNNNNDNDNNDDNCQNYHYHY